MIISNSRKFIFIHIPKCGGTSVSNVLDRHLRAQDVSLAVNPNAGWGKFVETYKKRFGLYKHSTSAEVAKAMGKKYFLDYEVFTFVRNPFSRAYSAFTFTKRADAKYRPESERYQEIKDMDFEAFLRSRYMQEKKMLPAQSQSTWVENPHKTVIAHKLENAADELPSLLSRHYGADIKIGEMPRANSSTERDDWRQISSTAKQIILDLYKEDFERFDYPKEI